MNPANGLCGRGGRGDIGPCQVNFMGKRWAVQRGWKAQGPFLGSKTPVRLGKCEEQITSFSHFRVLHPGWLQWLDQRRQKVSFGPFTLGSGFLAILTWFPGSWWRWSHIFVYLHRYFLSVSMIWGIHFSISTFLHKYSVVGLTLYFDFFITSARRGTSDI